MSEKFNYVYKSTCIVEGEDFGKFYIGSHYGKLNDDYFGTGVSMLNLYKKYGKINSDYLPNFKKEILCICESRQDAYDKETELISSYINDSLCINKSLHGVGVKCHSKEAREKMSLRNKNRSSIVKAYVGKKLRESNSFKLSIIRREKDPSYIQKRLDHIHKLTKSEKFSKCVSKNNKIMWENPDYRNKMTRKWKLTQDYKGYAKGHVFNTSKECRAAIALFGSEFKRLKDAKIIIPNHSSE